MVVSTNLGYQVLILFSGKKIKSFRGIQLLIILILSYMKSAYHHTYAVVVVRHQCFQRRSLTYLVCPSIQIFCEQILENKNLANFSLTGS